MNRCKIPKTNTVSSIILVFYISVYLEMRVQFENEITTYAEYTVAVCNFSLGISGFVYVK